MVIVSFKIKTIIDHCYRRYRIFTFTPLLAVKNEIISSEVKTF